MIKLLTTFFFNNSNNNKKNQTHEGNVFNFNMKSIFRIQLEMFCIFYKKESNNFP